jgi:hypothetical protein
MLTGQTRRPLIWLCLAVTLLSGVLLAGAMRNAFGAGSEPLLPNLVADPPDNISLATDSSTGTTRLLLRFNGYVHNTGPGALDFRGSREAPKVSKKVEEEVEHAREHEESPLPQKTEEELASPPMKVTQRLFTTNAGNSQESEKYLERPHIEESSGGEMIYVNADGHHHWHLQKVAKYSLWNSTKTAEFAPAQKVGFCLEDSEHVEKEKGPATAVYSDEAPPYRDFCQQYRPNATSVYEGISPGWRDLYRSDLAFQWVDVSNVLPGEYWLREDVNPLGVVKEEPGENQPAYAKTPTIIPGFDALPKTATTEADLPVAVTLESRSWEDSTKPVYTIVSEPEHGTLSGIEVGDRVTYTPTPGYSGPDSFTFAAADPNSQFPQSPAIATVSIVVGEGQLSPSVAIGGAPADMVAGTNVQLSASVSNDSPVVTWSASAGTITSSGLYTAPAVPPPGGTVTVVVRTAKGAHDQRTIEIKPALPPQPAPEAPAPTTPPPTVPQPAPGAPLPTTPSGPGSPPPAGSVSSAPPSSSVSLPSVSRPRAMLVGRKLIMTTYVTKAGHIRLSAYLGHRRLGTCTSRTPAKRTFTCQVTLGSKVSLRARISVWASLRIGRRILQSLRPAAQIAQMKMAGASALVHSEGGSSAQFWCSPSFLPTSAPAFR